MNILSKLQRTPVVNALVKNLRLYRAADLWLRARPRTRRTPGGLQYRIDSTASLVAANEAFAMSTYASAIRAAAPRTFIDVGSNVGYFPVLLAESTGSRDVAGLCVEANPSLWDAIEHHIAANRLANVTLVRGAVSAAAKQGETTFYINPSHIASSLTGRFNPLIPVGGQVRQVTVRLIDLAEEWSRRFGHTPVDLMKVDVEGAEVGLFRSLGEFMRRVNAVVVEWHAWATTLAATRAEIEPFDLRFVEVLEEDRNVGTALFQRGV